MRYYVTLPSPTGVEQAPAVVTLAELPDGSWNAVVDGRSVNVDMAKAGAQTSFRLDGRVMDVTTYANLPDLDIVANGQRVALRVESERTKSVHRASSSSATHYGAIIVKSPMPGRVVRVLVAPGDRVVRGQGLLVLEAMKMENEVRASAEATVVDVLVSAGAAVEANGRLMTLAVTCP